MFSEYDQNNVFAKIIRGDIPTKIVFENDHAICINDIKPAAPVHILILPRKPYICFDEFIDGASSEEITAYYAAINKVIEIQDLKKDGYRLITNARKYGNQTIPHFHSHLLSGKDLGLKLIGD